MAIKVIAKNSGVHCNQVRPDQVEWGEIAINFHASGPFLQVKDSEDNIIRVGGVIFQDEQPLCAQKGAWWYSHRHEQLYLHDGDQWIPIGEGKVIEWDDIINRPECFQPCDHTHPWDQVTDKPDCFEPCAHTHPPTEWGEIPDKPDCFEPCPHRHDASEIDNLPDPPEPPEVNDGKLTVKTEGGDTLGEFTANQDGDTEVVIPDAPIPGPPAWGEITDKPDCFEPCEHEHPPTPWPDIPEKPDCFEPCDHAHKWPDIEEKPDCFPPCEHTHPPTDWGEIPNKPDCFDPCAHTHPWGEVTDKPATYPPSPHTHALKDLSDTDVPDPQDKDVLTYDSALGKWASGDGVWVDPGTRVMGVTDISKPAPPDPTPGDIWIHHDEQLGREAHATDIADGSWVGVAGEEFWEGEYVIFSTDNVWHHGGQTTELNWDQIQNKPSCFNPCNHTHPWGEITDKPGCYTPCAHRHEYSEIDNVPPPPVVNNGKLTINNSDGTKAGEFTANQAGNTNVTLPKGFSGDYNDLINKPVIPDPFPEAPDDGNVYVRNGRTKSWVRGLPYDIRTLPELP